jgi:hypothetical protein
MDLQALFDAVVALVLLAWAYDGVKVIACHTLINVFVAIAAALKAGSFELGRVADFLAHKLAPYVLIYFVIKLFGDGAGVTFLAPIVWTAIEASLTGDLLDSWQKLGLPLPQSIQNFVVKRA